VTAAPSGTYTITGTVSPTGTQAVSGTVTAAPSGTYTVNVSNSSATLLTTAPAGTETGVVTRNIPSGTQTVSGTINSVAETASVSNSGNALTPKFAAFGAATIGDNTLISAVASKKIRVLSMMGVSSGATNIYFTSGSGGTVIFGGSTNKINLSANSGFVLPLNQLGWFETSSNNSLVVNLSAANSFSGGITYIEV
jgi:hypothetical protein